MSAIDLKSWPGAAEVAVAITFDVDAECGWLGEGEQYRERLTTLSEARYGVTRGVPRILELLDEFDVPATFYVPGDTAERHGEKLEGLKNPRHEIGHHGHMHLNSARSTPEQQREEIEQGLAALERHLDCRPRGYRSASWELTPETFSLLIEHGFEYDSSCMGDDRPYYETHGELSILELPVHWSLDDWPHFAWTVEWGGNLAAPQQVLDIWLAEFEAARRERRLMTLTMHPEVIGRGYRIGVLREFLERVSGREDVWLATHGSIVDHLRAEA